MKIHLMGIGGTGMASLAGMLKAAGHEVRGSDQGVYPPMSLLLEDMKIPVLCPYDPKNLEPAPDLVVIGNVISRGNPEVEAVLERGINYESMPEVVRKFFLQGKTSLVVAGAHGKTTTTALLAWVLESSGQSPGFFLGGKPRNFPQNFAIGSGSYFVLEGDEYDTAFFDKGPKFLHYEPKHLLLTSIEFDHADIYDSLDQILNSFRKLMKIIPADGSIVANLDFPEVAKLLQEYTGTTLTYTMKPELKDRADYFGEVLDHGEPTRFRIHRGDQSWDFSWDMVGEHNISNALGVAALAFHLGLSEAELKKAYATFQGVARRQEKLGEIEGVTLIDDFAHHPTAVRATLAGIRRRYPDRRVWALFEPRSNTSKRDLFQKQYAEAFDAADFVLLADVYMPEKVKDGKILNVDQVVKEINQRGSARAQHLSGTEAMVNALVGGVEPGDVVLLMSNGDFGGLGPKLLKGLEGGIGKE